MMSVISYTESRFSRSEFSNSYFLKTDCRSNLHFQLKPALFLLFVSVSFSAARITMLLDETTDDQLNEIMASWQRFIIEYNLRRFVCTSQHKSFKKLS